MRALAQMLLLMLLLLLRSACTVRTCPFLKDKIHDTIVGFLFLCSLDTIRYESSLRLKIEICMSVSIVCPAAKSAFPAALCGYPVVAVPAGVVQGQLTLTLTLTLPSLTLEPYPNLTPTPTNPNPYPYPYP